MDRKQWSQPTDTSTAAARAGGRRRWNHARQIRALERRVLVVQVSLHLLQDAIAAGQSFRGKQVLIAEVLGVHPSTISRDLKRSREMSLLFAPCPTCGQRTPRHELEARVSALAARLRAFSSDGD